MPLVTLLAAQSAAFSALDPARTGEPGLTRRYWALFRSRVRPALPVQLIGLLVAAAMALDLGYGLALGYRTPPGALFSLLGTAGWMTLVLLRSAVASSLGDEAGSVRLVLRRAVTIAGISPGRTLVGALGDLAVVSVAVLTLGFLPLVVGPVLLAQAALVAGSRRRLRTMVRSAA